ncbi:MAG TPA: type II toxin-antitoxin system HicB family antitoxin [Azospirillaceae bacterium]|nr:type II toxin-antitoxin system HicB family antitoxin [Azospirillaceae bacterium]
MTRVAYPAVIVSPDAPEGAYGVLFPDLPGCYSAGDSVEHAFLAAAEALEGHLSILAEEGPLPKPSSLDEARAVAEAEQEPDDGPVAAVLLVPATLPGRTQRFNVTLDENLVAQIDSLTGNRSAFLADAARAELRRRQGR